MSEMRVRGARQNNLRGIDLDLPLGGLIVVTGPSGSGKSSLAFDTLYAEGQRRYVETFSPYTRQFLERMDKPRVDSIEGIPPAIAIQQTNTVRTTRSTVGTITEINDYLKLFFTRTAQCHCPECGGVVKPESVAEIASQILRLSVSQPVLITFAVEVPEGTPPADFFSFLNQQGYLRVLLYGKVLRTDEAPSQARLPGRVAVIQDRIEVLPQNRSRMREAVEAALRLGHGRLEAWDGERGHPFSSGWHCAHCDRTFRAPSPGLFSFNNPLGACPTCRGFGRVMGIDWHKALPDRKLSIQGGVVRPFQTSSAKECQRDLLRAARQRGVNVRCPFAELSAADQDWVIQGDGGAGSPEEVWEAGGWYGVKGYFDWLEGRVYKMHVRVLLSRYRAYTPCPDCGGRRFQPETLNFRIEPSGLDLPQVLALPVGALEKIFTKSALPRGDSAAALLRGQILSRLRYLEAVGLGHLTLDRPTRTLSGGEISRVNLTTCLGASLTNTLFVLDEPSVGLHPQDTGRLLRILEGLRDKGNTVLVVEHEEAVIRSADHLVDIGPGRGAEGGQLMYSGSFNGLVSQEVPASLTSDYLTGRKQIPVPRQRRKPRQWIRARGIHHHNLRGLNVDIPVGVMTCISGVSGSGKSSLLHGVLHPALSGNPTSDDADYGRWDGITGRNEVGGILMVDQSPLARTPRSTPAVFMRAYDPICWLFGSLPESQMAGLSHHWFSFNAGRGRCPRCNGLGFEKIEMQFLSDLFLRCGLCNGRRFQPQVLAIRYRGLSIADVLELTVSTAIQHFVDHPAIVSRLTPLEEVGLGYLRLGQPLNQLSGGESQRLKLVREIENRQADSLILLDEPTTGLHFDDIARLLVVFQRLVEQGNTLVIVEHNLDVLKCADWILDIGPGAGADGGQLVATGSPESLATAKNSLTGKFLRKVLKGRLATTPEEGALTRKTPGAAPGLPSIQVRGAREHNLKNLDLDIPRGKMVVVTGLSGSGKSTLAFDILFAEGQRRFLDSMSAYSRQFIEQLEKPDVDSVEGLPPSVAIEQRVTRGGSKSTVATITEVYHFLRLLFAKLGRQHCPKCQTAVAPLTESEILKIVLRHAKSGRARLFAPLVRGRKGFHASVALWASKNGIKILEVDGREIPTEDFVALDRFKEHSISALIGEIDGATRGAPELIRRALDFGRGVARLVDASGQSRLLSTEMNCPGCGEAFDKLDPRLFSFNSPYGWCPDCHGFGITSRLQNTDRFASNLEAELEEEKTAESLAEPTICPSCAGTRLNEIARHVFLDGQRITDLAAAPAARALGHLQKLNLPDSAARIAADILPEIQRRLEFLGAVGLDYLSLDRAANTLSGGESQRIRLAAQLGSNLQGVLYVLDEPTIGLHAQDNARLLDALSKLAKNGNSLVIVEHDEETMRRADYVIDLGPGGGSRGGEIVAAGGLPDILANEASQTGAALREPMRHPLRGARRPLKAAPAWVRIVGASLHNLKNLSVRFPVNRLTVITGVSGSGKSSLVRGVIEPALAGGSRGHSRQGPQPWKAIQDAEFLDGVLVVDQSPIGKTPRSTPSTYTKVFDSIRSLYAELPASRARGYSASRFSFNNKGGRCEACAGQGVIKLEMSFLPPAYMPCQECGGSRYNSATLEIELRGRSIADVMRMTADEAAAFFAPNPKIARPLNLMVETGLGYLQLGQPSPTLSGGEAQRIKLITQLARRATPKAGEIRTGHREKSPLYILEEPTIGLHAHDVSLLIGALHRLVDEGGTVLVVEHHLDIIAEADYLLDLGPGAGEDGGRLVSSGTPETVSRHKTSRTAPFLREVLSRPAPPKSL